MREIKFRGKDVITGKWVYGYYVNSGDNHFILGDWEKGKGHRQYMVDSKTVGQYAGLKDKNGSEIYECDYVDYGTSGIQEIIFDMGGFGFKKNNGYMFQIIDGVGEVIGNIYENLELLNSKQI